MCIELTILQSVCRVETQRSCCPQIQTFRLRIDLPDNVFYVLTIVIRSVIKEKNYLNNFLRKLAQAFSAKILYSLRARLAGLRELWLL